MLGAHQDLGLPACLGFALTLILGVGGREVAAIGGDDRVEKRPAKLAEFSTATEIGNRLPAAQVLADAITRRGIMVPERLFHDRDVVGLQRILVPVEYGADFGNNDGRIYRVGHGFYHLEGRLQTS